MDVQPDKAQAVAEQQNNKREIDRYMNQEQIKELFMQGIDCSQVVAGEFAEKTGMSKKQLRKMSACFGGGMMCGETCGAVTGALMVIGLVYGHDKEGDMAQKEIMTAKVAEFKKLLAEKYPSFMCRDMLGHDVSQPGEFEKVLEEGTMFSFCPALVEDTIQILEKIL